MKWITLVAALGACIALTSCDDPDQVQHAAQKASAAAPATCPCHPGQSQSATATGPSTKMVAAGRHHSMYIHKHGANGTYSMDLSAPGHVSSQHRARSWRAADAHADAIHREHAMRTWQRDETRINGAVLARNDHGVRIWHGRPGMSPNAIQHPRYGHDWRHHNVDNGSTYYARNERYARDWRGHYTPGWAHRYSRTDFTAGVLVPYNYVSRSQVTYIGQDTSYSRDYTRRDTIPATMSGARLDPWHGYDVDCPRQ